MVGQTFLSVSRSSPRAKTDRQECLSYFNPNQNLEAACPRVRLWPSSSLLRISSRGYLLCGFPEKTSRQIYLRADAAAPQESPGHFPGRRLAPPSPVLRVKAQPQTPRPPPVSPGSTGTSRADYPVPSYP